MKLTGNRCKCATCGEYFNSERGFVRHRVKGVCRTPDQLLMLGWSKNKAAFWITETHEQRAARAAAHRVFPGDQN
jgi:hypothetical protein